MTPVRFVRFNEAAQKPCYATDGSAGADLYACLPEPIHLRTGNWTRVPTGIGIELPRGFEAQVRPRSGLADKFGITVLNTPGTIDSDYRGQIEVILTNFGENDFVIKSGDRIAQLIVAPVVRASFAESAGIGSTNRGSGGFGSTGVAAA